MVEKIEMTVRYAAKNGKMLISHDITEPNTPIIIRVLIDASNQLVGIRCSAHMSLAQ
jgi:hypothetical protein